MVQGPTECHAHGLRIESHAYESLLRWHHLKVRKGEAGVWFQSDLIMLKGNWFIRASSCASFTRMSPVLADTLELLFTDSSSNCCLRPETE